MKKTGWSLLLALVVATPVVADEYKIDPVGTTVGFAIRHLGITNVKGTFDTFTGTVAYDGKDLSTFRLTLEADVNSINTKNEKRDAHLQNADFFDEPNHPKLTFKTTSVKDKKITGDLTMRGTTKEITADLVELAGPIDSPFAKGVKVIGFTGTATVDRQDFNVGSDAKFQKTLGNEVKIEITLEAKK